jgi:agmatine deiminase
MIIDNQTNFLYFSSQLKKSQQYQSFSDSLNEVLTFHEIPFGFIEYTRDIWCRDYMPIQVSENEFVQFSYFPDYCLTPVDISKITIPSETRFLKKLNIIPSKLIVDGGNIVKSNDTVIMTNKVLNDNKKFYGYSEKTILSRLKSDLKVDNIIIIPKQPYDIFGHSDGMVRFYDEKTLFISDFSKESLSWQKKIFDVLNSTGFELKPFPTEIINEKSKEGIPSAKGIYINYAQLGNIILFPQFDIPDSDSEALSFMRKHFPEPVYKIIPINCNEIAVGGGVLNCITWNIKTHKSSNFNTPLKKVPNFDEQEKYVFDLIEFYLSTFDYQLIASSFSEVWNKHSGTIIGDGDLKNHTYDEILKFQVTNNIPQFYVDTTINLIIEYLESIGQYGFDISEN